MADESGTLPRAWHFVPCDSVSRWGGGICSLNKVRLRLLNPLGHGLPRFYSALTFYIALTDATGRHTIRVEQTCLRDQTRLIHWPAFTLDMGDDPTAVHEVDHVLRDVAFWEPGQCEFLLYCGAALLSQAVIDVR